MEVLRCVNCILLFIHLNNHDWFKFLSTAAMLDINCRDVSSRFLRREVTTRNWFIVHGVVRCNFISGVSRIISALFLALQVSPYEIQHVKFFSLNLLIPYSLSGWCWPSPLCIALSSSRSRDSGRNSFWNCRNSETDSKGSRRRGQQERLK